MTQEDRNRPNGRVERIFKERPYRFDKSETIKAEQLFKDTVMQAA
jgi:hypothetical protein